MTNVNFHLLTVAVLGQIQATTSYLPGSQKTIKWAPEMIMLFWESLQCNKESRCGRVGVEDRVANALTAISKLHN